MVSSMVNLVAGVISGNDPYFAIETRDGVDPWYITEKFRIDDAGNVGIGTSEPDKVLAVNGTFGCTGSATFKSDVTLGDAAADVTTVTGRLTASVGMFVPDGEGISIQGPRASPGVMLHAEATTNGDAIRIDSDATTKFGCLVFGNNGDTSDYGLIALAGASGGAVAIAGVAHESLCLRTQGNDQQIAFSTDGGNSTVLVIDGTNVGIGPDVLSPGSTLTVDGTFGCSGNVTLGDAANDKIVVTGVLESTGSVKVTGSADHMAGGWALRLDGQQGRADNGIFVPGPVFDASSFGSVAIGEAAQKSVAQIQGQLTIAHNGHLTSSGGYTSASYGCNLLLRGTGANNNTRFIQADESQYVKPLKIIPGYGVMVLSSSSGGGTKFKIDNATTDTDPMIAFDQASTTKWIMGVDTSESGTPYIISNGSSIDSTASPALALYDDGASQYGGYAKMSCQHASGYALEVTNVGAHANAAGISIKCGEGGTGTGVAMLFQNGSGTSQGSITFSDGTVSYNTFTGGHHCSIPEEDNETGYVYGTLLKIVSTISSHRHVEYVVEKTTQANDKAALGVYSGRHPSVLQPEENLHLIYSLGDGHILVCDEGGNIEIGDYICSSNTEGYGMKQSGDMLYNYTVAKASETVDWSAESTTTKLVACTYHAA